MLSRVLCMDVCTVMSADKQQQQEYQKNILNKVEMINRPQRTTITSDFKTKMAFSLCVYLS